MKVEISENLAVHIWDELNEAALNSPSKVFRRAAIKHRNSLEIAMQKAGLGVPRSSNGRAEIGKGAK